jgi:hypothetical protein
MLNEPTVGVLRAWSSVKPLVYGQKRGVVIPQILEQALALTGNGHWYYGHAAKFPMSMRQNPTLQEKCE